MLGIRFLTNTCRLKIKTIRRQAYGFRDTEYFFLKIMEASRKPYYRYQSHRILS